MQARGVNSSRYGLEHHGIQNVNQVYWNLGTAALVGNAIRRREGLLAAGGAFVVRTGQYTGRSPDDKFVVQEPSTQDRIWWGPVNRPFDSARFDALYGRLLAYLQGSDLYVQDCFAGADPDHRIPIRIITEYAWHNLFARQLFGLQVPTACPDVPALILSPRTTWPKAEAYDAQAERLAALFRKNFEQFGDVPAGVREAGPTDG
jgi:ATP-dependent phosphoenolpyruvate carboxykinase